MQLKQTNILNKYQLLFPNNNNNDNEQDIATIFYISITNNLNLASLYNNPEKSSSSSSSSIFFYSNHYPLFFNQPEFFREKQIHNHHFMESCIKDMIQQIHFLETHNLSLVTLDLQDVLNIHQKNCVFVNHDSILPITKEKQIVIDFPVITNMFSSPELLSIQEIPSSISYKNIYYSIGAFILFVFLRKNIQLILLEEDDEETQKKKLEKELIPIFHTKIYWFLRRCLKKDPSKRVLLL